MWILSTLVSFTACRLIALDKHPEVRPIGVGEVARRIISKAILSAIERDIKQQQETSSSALDRHRDVKLEFIP